MRPKRQHARVSAFLWHSTVAAACTLGGTASLALNGCVESAIAAAGVTAGMSIAQGQAESFIRGELKAARMVPLAEAHAAVHAALAELHLAVRTDRLGVHDGYVRGKSDGGREVKVSLKADSAVMTRFTIRIGIMGDAAVSRLVMARIDRAIGLAQPFDMPAPILGSEPMPIE